MSEQTKTPRADAIRFALYRKYPDPIPMGKKILYYMEAAEAYGQELREVERELSSAEARAQALEAALRELVDAAAAHDRAWSARYTDAAERKAVMEPLIARVLHGDDAARALLKERGNG